MTLHDLSNFSLISAKKARLNLQYTFVEFRYISSAEQVFLPNNFPTDFTVHLVLISHFPFPFFAEYSSLKITCTLQSRFSKQIFTSVVDVVAPNWDTRLDISGAIRQNKL